ncbi:hypothetical protein Dimus_030568 [Dionaea muscipula]
MHVCSPRAGYVLFGFREFLELGYCCTWLRMHSVLLILSSAPVHSRCWQKVGSLILWKLGRAWSSLSSSLCSAMGVRPCLELAVILPMLGHGSSVMHGLGYTRSSAMGDAQRGGGSSALCPKLDSSLCSAFMPQLSAQSLPPSPWSPSFLAGRGGAQPPHGLGLPMSSASLRVRSPSEFG